MSRILGWLHRARSMFRRRAADAETREELQYHIDRQTAKHVAEGLGADAARRLAIHELGGTERWREATADVRTGVFTERLMQDGRYAIRSLLRRPAFSITAVLTFAVGIGANVAIFSVLDAAVLRRLPFPHPEQLMSISLRMPVQSGAHTIDMVWSYPKYVALRDRQHVFSGMALHAADVVVVGGSDGAERIAGETVGARYFDLLGVPMALGRSFTEDEDRPGDANHVIVLGDALWRTRFSGDRTVLGRQIMVRGAAYTVIGVAPPGFAGLTGLAQLWTPVSSSRAPEALAQVGAHNLELLGRLADGVSAAAARDATRAIGREIDQLYPDPDSGTWGADTYLLNDLRINPALKVAVFVLGASVALVLLIACVNLVTLILARSAARRQEIAVRLAIGATRGRIVQQVVTETVLLSVAGLVAAMAIAWAAVRLLVTVLPASSAATRSQSDLTRITLATISLDGRAFGVGAILALGAGLIVGAAAAAAIARQPIGDALRKATTAAASFGGLRRLTGRGALVAAEIALANVLLFAAALSVASLGRVLSLPLGYRPDHLLTLRVSLDPQRSTGDSVATSWAAVAADIRTIPGVSAVAFGSCAPIGEHCEGTSIGIEGHPGAAHVSYHVVSSDYFRTLGVKMLDGREFDAHDRADGQAVVIVNRAAARTFWGTDDPLRTAVHLGDATARVVGVVDDVRYEDLESPAAPAIFVPFARASRSRALVFVRTAGDPVAAVAAIRSRLRSAHPNHAVGEILTMEDRLRDATARNRLSAGLLAVFAAVALALAAIGIYGLIALSVAQRARELAVRRALGASQGALLSMVLSQVGGLVIAGTGAGLLLALGAGRFMATVFYGVKPFELGSFATGAGLLALSALLAALIPSLRAMRADPREAMRAE